MILSDISVKRPVFASVLSLLIILFGILSYQQLPLREYPDIDPPVVSIETIYIGAAADIVETRVTQIIEDIISGVEGIESIDSTSEDGRSSITVEFQLNRDVDAAANDIRDRVSRVLNQLPDEVEAPEISKLDTNTQEVVWLALQSESRTGLELTDYADRYLIDRLSTVPGVARVRIGGERRYAMRIWLDKQAMAARNITAQDVENALLAENVELPAGRIESLNREFTVRTERTYRAAKDFQDLIIRRGDDGYLVRLNDVAKVEIGAENERTTLRSNGINTVGLGISKQSKANTLEVARGAKKEMANIAKGLPDDLAITVAYDSSIFIENAIKEVWNTLFITIALVVVVIFCFLGDWRATLVPALTIPVALIGSFIVLAALGFTVNLLTLLALVLAIGLVVDDSIVVLENIYKRIEQNQPALSASFLGTRQVSFAVIATTLVLIAVFIPITFMPGDVGKLFTEFAWGVAGAVIFSSFIALTLTPMLASKLLKRRAASKKKNIITRAINAGFDKFDEPYKATLRFLIIRPWIVILASLFLIAAGVFFSKLVPSEYSPVEDRGVIFTFMITPEGSSMEYTKRQSEDVEQYFLDLLDTGEADRIVTILPGTFTTSGSVNTAIIISLLNDWDKRDRNVQTIVGDISAKLNTVPGAMAFANPPPSLGQDPVSTPVQFVIQGTEYEQLAQWRDLMVERMRENPNFVYIDTDYKETKPQIKLEIDVTRAGELGVSTRAIGSTLETMFGSRQVTTYQDRGEEYDVVLQARDEDRLTPEDMETIYVRSDRTGELIPLSNLVRYTETATSASLNRYNRLRSITISAVVPPFYALGDALEYMEKAADELLPREARIDYKGTSKEFKDTGNQIYFTFALALVAVFLILAAQFESFIHPFVVMTAVPFAIVGAMWGLFLDNQSLNVYTQIGLIMLVGLAAKNGILIVEFANQLRDEGMQFFAALMTACEQRIRPIVMTAISTMAGAVPLIMATGAGAESRIPLGVVIFSGVLLSTFLTLFVVPVFYAFFARGTNSPEHVARMLDEELKELKHDEKHAAKQQ